MIGRNDGSVTEWRAIANVCIVTRSKSQALALMQSVIGRGFAGLANNQLLPVLHVSDGAYMLLFIPRNRLAV